MNHYYAEHPDVESKEHEIDYHFNGQNFTFISDRGVFSKDHVDQGSELLLQGLHDHLKELSAADSQRFKQLTNGKSLDMGTGYGVLGIVAKRRWPGQDWTFSDVNERALHLASRNARNNGIYNPEVIKSHSWENLTGQFDLIVTNPPIRIGKEAVYDMFRGAATHLTPGGLFVTVIGKKQGAESAGRFLAELFTEVLTIEKKKGFSVYACSGPRAVE